MRGEREHRLFFPQGRAQKLWHQGLASCLKSKKGLCGASWVSLSLEFALKSLFIASALTVQALWNRPLCSLLLPFPLFLNRSWNSWHCLNKLYCRHLDLGTRNSVSGEGPILISSHQKCNSFPELRREGLAEWPKAKLPGGWNNEWKEIF